jgi:CRISPR-associated protein Cas5d
VVDAVSVLRPIQFSEPATAADAGVDGRSISLRDVGYVIDAHFEMTRRAGPADDPVRHRGMFKRQIRAGAKVFLGSENHPGEATLLSDADEEPSPVDVTCDLGWMVHEADYEDRRRLRFFRAHLVRGVIAVPCPGSALLFG